MSSLSISSDLASKLTHRNDVELLKNRVASLQRIGRRYLEKKCELEEKNHELNDEISFLKEKIFSLETTRQDDRWVIEQLNVEVQGALDERVCALQSRICFLEARELEYQNVIGALNQAAYLIPNLEKQIFDLQQTNANNTAYIEFLESQNKH